MSDETHDFTAMWSEAEPAEVMRLPDWLRAQVGPTHNPAWSGSMNAAADRLEALEAERDSLATTIDGWVDKVHALEAELERIHAVMAEVDDEVDPLDAELADAHAIESDLRAELAAERAKTRTERDLRRRYGIAYAKKVQQLHEAAEDHAQSLAALTETRLEVRHWQAEVAAEREQNGYWMNGVADIVEPLGFDRDAACGPADLLPGLRWMREELAAERALADQLAENVDHGDGCARRLRYDRPCTCGATAALAAHRAARTPQEPE